MSIKPAPSPMDGTAARTPVGRAVRPGGGAPRTPGIAPLAEPSHFSASGAPKASRSGRVRRGAGTGETPSPGRGTSPPRPGEGTKTARRKTPSGLAAVAAAMSEDKGPDSLDAHVRKLIKDLSLWGLHVERSLDLDTGRTNVSRKGWPDWTILGECGGLFRELKAEDGKPSKEQRDVGARLRRAGFDWDIWTPSDLLSGRIQRELAAIAGSRWAA